MDSDQPMNVEDSIVIAFVSKLNALFDDFRKKEIFAWKTPIREQERRLNFPDIPHLFDDTQLILNKGILTKYYQYLLEMLSSEMDWDSENVQTFKQAILDKKISEEEFLKYTLGNEVRYFLGISREHSITIDFLGFFSTILGRPYREKAIKELQDGLKVQEDWQKGTCPGCGHFPHVSVIPKQEGQRRLWCFCCNSMWNFPNDKCPVCLITDKEKLNYILLEDYPAYRLYTCDNCRRYLKTIVEKKYPKPSLNFDRLFLSTPSLDQIALQQRYIQDNILGIPERS